MMLMLETVLKAKVHRAVVTETELDYEGSIAIGRNLMEAANIRPYEQVMVANFTNGARWWTYAIPADDGVIGLNGGSARMGVVGDVVAIFTYVGDRTRSLVDRSDLFPAKRILFLSGDLVEGTPAAHDHRHLGSILAAREDQ